MYIKICKISFEKVEKSQKAIALQRNTRAVKKFTQDSNHIRKTRSYEGTRMLFDSELRKLAEI